MWEEDFMFLNNVELFVTPVVAANSKYRLPSLIYLSGFDAGTQCAPSVSSGYVTGYVTGGTELNLNLEADLSPNGLLKLPKTLQLSYM